MKVKLDKVPSTPSGLVMGVLIHGPKDSWVRFAILEVPWEMVTEQVILEYWKYKDRDEREIDYDIPLDLGWT